MIRLEDHRSTALQVGYMATDWNEPPRFDQYAASLESWNVRLMMRGPEPIGAVYTKGPEFHVSVLPEWRGRWATRSMLRTLIAEPVSITRVSPGFEHVAGLLLRLGFKDHGGGLFVRDSRHGH